MAAQQLLEEERVAAGALVQRGHGAVRRGRAGDRGEQRGGVGLGEPFERRRG